MAADQPTVIGAAGRIAVTADPVTPQTYPLFIISEIGRVEFSAILPSEPEYPVIIGAAGRIAVTADPVTPQTYPLFTISEIGRVEFSAELPSEPEHPVIIDAAGRIAITAEVSDAQREPYISAVGSVYCGDDEDPEISQIRWLEVSGCISINSGAFWMNYYIKTCTINIDLAPGETLVIDSDTYNVWKGNTNVTEAHSGDWIDGLTRETDEVDVQPNTGSLSSEIQYTERWL